jgi:hypothetical protein
MLPTCKQNRGKVVMNKSVRVRNAVRMNQVLTFSHILSNLPPNFHAFGVGKHDNKTYLMGTTQGQT